MDKIQTRTLGNIQRLKHYNKNGWNLGYNCMDMDNRSPLRTSKWRCQITDHSGAPVRDYIQKRREGVQRCKRNASGRREGHVSWWWSKNSLFHGIIISQEQDNHKEAFLLSSHILPAITFLENDVGCSTWQMYAVI